MKNKDGRIRKNVMIGATVQIVEKANQKNGHLTKGRVEKILTNAERHPHGIKVMIRSGEVGRVRKILQNKGLESPAPAAQNGVDTGLPFLDF